MANKRDNELVMAIESEIAKGSVSAELASQLLKAYKSATYKEWGDRHKWYRDLVEDMVNDCAFADEELATEMANNHPTLQQNFMRMCRKFIEKMAEKTYFDARNENSVKMAKKMVSAIENDTCLPFI